MSLGSYTSPFYLDIHHIRRNMTAYFADPDEEIKKIEELFYSADAFKCSAEEIGNILDNLGIASEVNF